MSDSQQLFDPSRIARNLRRAASRYEQHNVLHQRIWQDLLDRTKDIKRQMVPGEVHADLHPEAGEIAQNGWSRVQSATEPVTGQPQNLILSFLQLHREEQLPQQLRKLGSRLAADGVLLAAMFGERSLHELRSCLLQAETELGHGASARIMPFVDVRVLGSLVAAAGFTLPVIDVERIKVRYGSLQALFHDLRYMGEGNPLAGPVRPLGKKVLRRTNELYLQNHSDDKGRLIASFEVLHICGWAPHPDQPKALPRGSATMFLGDALKANKPDTKSD